MRCRVGRKPAACSISLTSCQGQPVSAGWRPAEACAVSSFSSERLSVISTCGTALSNPDYLVEIYGGNSSDASFSQLDQAQVKPLELIARCGDLPGNGHFAEARSL